MCEELEIQMYMMVREVSENGGFEAESDTATMTLQNKGTYLYQRKKAIFINTDHEEAMQLPMELDGVSSVAYTSMSCRAHIIVIPNRH